jgi:hypothetical protein
MWSALLHVYTSTLVPLSALGMAGGLFLGLATATDSMWKKLEFTTLCVFAGLISGILWPVVWLNEMCANSDYIFASLTDAMRGPRRDV